MQSSFDRIATPLTRTAVLLAAIVAVGCQPVDTQSLLIPRLLRSEVFGFVAGFGTTFAALPDLIAMFRRRSSAGMNPRMPAILCVFQAVWIYYGLLIGSRPVVAWNLVAVVINAATAAACVHFARANEYSR
jgi:MtN3 and saliva related transmembrane protein